MDIIEKIIYIKNELNLNQKSLAESLKISPQAINVILKRKSKPSLDTILALCQLCHNNGIPLEWLMLDITQESTEAPITEEEQELLKDYHNAKPEVQESVRILLKAGRAEPEKSFAYKTG